MKKIFLIIVVCLIGMILFTISPLLYKVYKEVYKDAIWKLEQEQTKKYKDALLQKILPDTSWVNLSIPIYYISNPPDSIDPKDAALYSINTDGTNKFKICEGKVKSANISPDGRYILFVITTDNYKKEIIYLFDCKNKETKLVKELEQIIPKEGYDIERWITEIIWAPDSKRFAYVIYNAFRFHKDKIGKEKEASMKDKKFRESGYLVNVDDLIEKELFKNRFLLLVGSFSEELFWDKDNEHLYFIELRDNKSFIIRLNVNNLKEVEVKSMPRDLVKQRRLFCGRIYTKTISEKGEELELAWDWDSEENYCIYKDIGGKEKRLFSFPRGVMPLSRYFERPTWLPGGRYAVLQFLDLIVILEPNTGKIGVLTKGEYLSPSDYESKEKWVY